MLRQVNRLDAIISDLLVLSRIEKGTEEQLIELARGADPAPCFRRPSRCARRRRPTSRSRSNWSARTTSPARSTPRWWSRRWSICWTTPSSTATRGPTVEVSASREGTDLVIRVQGPRLRHRGPAPAAAVRAVLSRRQGSQPRTGRHGPGAGDRPAHRPGPSRLGDRREHGRRRQHLLLAAAAWNVGFRVQERGRFCVFAAAPRGAVFRTMRGDSIPAGTCEQCLGGTLGKVCAQPPFLHVSPWYSRDFPACKS